MYSVLNLTHPVDQVTQHRTHGLNYVPYGPDLAATEMSHGKTNARRSRPANRTLRSMVFICVKFIGVRFTKHPQYNGRAAGEWKSKDSCNYLFTQEVLAGRYMAR